MAKRFGTMSSFVASGGGYSKVNAILNKCFNFALSIFLIICGVPFFVIIAIAIKLQDGGPVIFKQVRLGHNKKHFTMYKFRTLIPDAEKITGADAVSAGHSVVTPIGKILRETRLDELPQLFNILKGEMDFVGPRPQRILFYEKACKHIKGYDKRYAVPPGLIGHSQLFIPHSSTRRMQAFIDNRYIKKKQIFMWDIYIVIFTVLVVFGVIFKKIPTSLVLFLIIEYNAPDSVNLCESFPFLST